MAGLTRSLFINKVAYGEFHLSFDELMPVMLYQTFYATIELAFQQIAQVSVQITTNQTTFTEEQLTDYWQLALLNSQCNTPLVQKVLKKHRHHNLKIGKIILPVDNEAVIPYLKQQYLPIIEELYFSYGFPKFHIEPKMDQQQAAEVLKKFEEQKLEQAAPFNNKLLNRLLNMNK